MNHRVLVDFVLPHASVAADVVYFAYSRDPLGSGDIRLAVIYAQGTGYRVVLGFPAWATTLLAATSTP
jgi:hypothetical protein